MRMKKVGGNHPVVWNITTDGTFLGMHLGRKVLAKK